MGDQLEHTMPNHDSKSGKSEAGKVTQYELEGSQSNENDSNPGHLATNNPSGNLSIGSPPDEALNDHEDETGNANQNNTSV